MAKLKAPVMLVILDGFGMGDQSDTTNAVVQAKPLCFINYGIRIHIQNWKHQGLR